MDTAVAVTPAAHNCSMNTHPILFPIRARVARVVVATLLAACVAFVPSPAAAQAGASSCAAITDSITRLFSAFFLREPDASGRAYWTDQYLSGTLSLPGVATSFASSPEFRARYGALDDEQFVRLVYQNVLERAPDVGGLSFWTGRLRAGASRGLVMTGFSESPEYVTKTATAAPLSRTPFPRGTHFYCGSGSQVVEVAPPPDGAIVRAAMGGSSNNIIWTRSATLDRGDLLVNTIGAYRGDRLIHYGSSSRVQARHFEIISGGSWAIAVAPLSFAPAMGGETSGRGDAVIRVDRGPGVVELRHNGSRNFIIWAYTTSRAQLLANEIGAFHGQRVLERVPGYLEIQGDGEWSIRFS
jgi:hypothetical protein